MCLLREQSSADQVKQLRLWTAQEMLLHEDSYAPFLGRVYHYILLYKYLVLILTWDVCTGLAAESYADYCGKVESYDAAEWGESLFALMWRVL